MMKSFLKHIFQYLMYLQWELKDACHQSNHQYHYFICFVDMNIFDFKLITPSSSFVYMCCIL